MPLSANVSGTIIVPDSTPAVVNTVMPESVDLPNVEEGPASTFLITSNPGDRLVVPSGTFSATTTGTYYTGTAGGWLYFRSTSPTGGTAMTSAAFFTSSTTSTTVWCNASTGHWHITPAAVRELTEEDRARMRTIEILRKARDVEKAKPSIKRALRLMANFGMEEDVRVFMGGGKIEVSHPDSLFKFVLEKGHSSLIERTLRPGHSTPYRLGLYTKSDVHVADLCVYLKDTPILDQILAISMFIKTGNEEEILRKANFFSLSDDRETREIISLEHPSLSKKLLRWDEQEFLQ